MTFAGRIEKLLCALERETFQHLQLRYPLFLASPEYVLLLAQERNSESKKVNAYRSFNSFLEFVKKNNNKSFLHGISICGECSFDFTKHDPDFKEVLFDKLFVYHGYDLKYLNERDKNKNKILNENRYKNENNIKSSSDSQRTDTNQTIIVEDSSSDSATARTVPTALGLGLTSLKGIFGSYEIEEEESLESLSNDGDNEEDDDHDDNEDEDEDEDEEDEEEEDQIEIGIKIGIKNEKKENKGNVEYLSNLYPCLSKNLYPFTLSCPVKLPPMKSDSFSTADSSIQSYSSKKDFDMNENNEKNQFTKKNLHVDRDYRDNNNRKVKNRKAADGTNSRRKVHDNDDKRELGKESKKATKKEDDREEENDGYTHLPFMVDCLSPRTCVQLAMLLCTDTYVQLIDLCICICVHIIIMSD